MFHKIVESHHARRVRAFITGEAPLLAAMAIVTGLLLAFLQIADEMGEGGLEAFDTAILMAFRDPGNVDNVIGPAWVHEMVRDITALGSFAVLGIVVVAACGYLLMAGKRSSAVLILVSVLGGTLLSTVLKMGYDRPRPDLAVMSHQFTASFPSGHAMLSAVTFLTLGAILAGIAPNRRLQIFAVTAAILLTLLVGTSRVFMGVHYPSDVLAGWSIGAAWALFCSAVAIVLRRMGKVDAPSHHDNGAGAAGDSARGVTVPDAGRPS
ncbi:MAG: phosphatase PAP2 family protein [Devosia sp.]